MPTPDFLCARVRNGTNMLTGVLTGGTIFEQFGQDLGGVDTVMSGERHYVNCLVRFTGRWWCVSRGRIYVFNTDTRRWTLSLEPQGQALANDQKPRNDSNFYGVHSGLFIANTATSGRALYFGYANNNFPYNMVFWRFDPTNTDTTGRDGRPDGRWDIVNGAASYSNPYQFAVLRFHRGTVYARTWLASQTGQQSSHTLSGGVSNDNKASNPTRFLAHSTFFSLDDRIFTISPNPVQTSGFVQDHNVEELIGATWSDRNADGWNHNFVAHLHGLVNQNSGAALGVLRLGDAVYIFGGGNNLTTTANDSGLLVIKLTIPVPGGPTVFADVTDPVIPAAYRPQPGSGAVINGTNGGAREVYVTAFVDDQTDPANPVGYVLFSPNDSGQSSPLASTFFQFNGDSTPMTLLAAPPTNGAYAYPDCPYGVGAYLEAPPTSTPLLEGYLEGTGEKAIGGARLRYRLAGDPLLLEFVDNDIRLRHGVVSSGPFVIGEDVTGAVSTQVGVVTAVNANDVEVTYLPPDDSTADGFSHGEIITGGTSGATAVLNIEHTPVWSGGPFTVAEVIELGEGGSDRSTVVAVNADNLEVSQITTSVSSNTDGKEIVGVSSATRARLRLFGAVSGRFELRETVTGGMSGATAVIDRINSSSIQLGSVRDGPFQAGETITGDTSGASRVLSTIVSTGTVNNGPFQVGETVTQAVSGATGVVTRTREDWNGYGSYLALTSITGAFVTAQEITGGTSSATTTSSSGELDGLGGGATHTVRFRFHFGSGPTGIGTPDSPGGICTLVAASATGNSSVVNGNDVENVTADNRTLYGVLWDFEADGVNSALTIRVKVEAVRI